MNSILRNSVDPTTLLPHRAAQTPTPALPPSVGGQQALWAPSICPGNERGNTRPSIQALSAGHGGETAGSMGSPRPQLCCGLQVLVKVRPPQTGIVFCSVR